MASWVFFPPPPHPPTYLHSLFRDTLGPVWIGCLLRRQAKHFSTVRWHCHLGSTRRPSRSQDLTGLLDPDLAFLHHTSLLAAADQQPWAAREWRCPYLGCVFPDEGTPTLRGEWKVFQQAWGGGRTKRLSFSSSYQDLGSLRAWAGTGSMWNLARVGKTNRSLHRAALQGMLSWSGEVK